MKKKAQGLSLNVIIVAALALIVLIVLWAIFTGRMGATAKGLTTHQRCIDVCTSVGKDVGSTTDKLDPQATTAAASADHCDKTDASYVGDFADATRTSMQTCCCTS